MAPRGASPRFWAAAYERGAEFGGLGEGAPSDDALVFALKRDAPAPANTTLAVVATDAPLDKAQATRLAIMATAGFALALRPAFAPTDGDVVFAASTARADRAPDLRDLAEIGTLAAECLARAVARGVYEATPLPFKGAMASWKGKWGSGQ
jgi:D-aminopeptidase